MTNVPEETRAALADAYKLFDVNYNMEGAEDDWIRFWKWGHELVQKYGDDIPLLPIITAYAGIIEVVINRRKTGNQSLLWGADEDYPYPKEECKNGANKSI